jgi:uncharacterized oligopeptide transporter (OPT) family protein
LGRRGAALVAFTGNDHPTSTFGAGMIVGARISLASLVGGLVSWAMIPYFVSIGWLTRRSFPQDHVLIRL